MSLKNLKKIKKQLFEEIEKLENKRGFLNAGFPKFDYLFGRDSLISSWQLLKIKPEIEKNTLKILSKLQGKKVNKITGEEPGKILHEYPFEVKSKGNLPLPNYFSIDSTLLFIILFSFYFKKTKDIKFLNSHWGNILKAIYWIENYGDVDNDLYIEYQRQHKNALLNQGWKDSDFLRSKQPIALVEVQGYQYLALKEVIYLAKVKGENKLAQKLEKRSQLLRENFNNDFWMENLKYFALGFDGNKKQIKKITSNPGHLLFTRIINDKRKVELVVKRLFKKDLFTLYGIRTHSSNEDDFDPKSYHLGSVWPFDNWIIAQGLKNYGYLKEYQKIKKAILRAYNKLGFLPEYYAVIDKKIIIDLPSKPCFPQAWSTGALLNFLTIDVRRQ